MIVFITARSIQENWYMEKFTLSPQCDPCKEITALWNTEEIRQLFSSPFAIGIPKIIPLDRAIDISKEVRITGTSSKLTFQAL